MMGGVGATPGSELLPKVTVPVATMVAESTGLSANCSVSTEPELKVAVVMSVSPPVRFIVPFPPGGGARAARITPDGIALDGLQPGECVVTVVALDKMSEPEFIPFCRPTIEDDEIAEDAKSEGEGTKLASNAPTS